ncbi:MAG: hypothetical protein HY288_08365 [Planctomycetia bacterium]|nr:hypothetical protein [Planctomycetia bacterium]
MARAKALAIGLVVLVSMGPRFLCAAGVVAARASLYSSYGDQLNRLAEWCEKRQLPEAAEQLKAWLPRRDPDQLTLFVLPSSEAPTDKDKSSKSDWRKRWQVLRDDQADALVALARQAVSEHRPSLAYELVTEAVRENPDHKQGRRLLGYIKFRDAWHTPFEVRQLSGNKVWHEKFGWLPKSQVERYAKGQRNYQGRWMPAAEEADLRHDLKRGWRIESDHYIVTTNHSLEEGVRLARRLETLYAIWQQVFVAYLADEAELARRFEGRLPRREPRQHNVVYYRSREEYNDALRSRQPQIEITLGIYFGNEQMAHFFAGKDQEAGTLYHEATHQLFQETRPVVPDVARNENFWIVEGIACYMESLAEGQGYYTLGGRDAGRIQAARERLLKDEFYVPLAQLVLIGMEGLQRDSRLPKLYSESAGLTTFLMQDSGGRYRDPLVRYLDAIYTGRATTKTLAEATGTDYETLDRQYREYMSRSEPADEGKSKSPR